MEAGHGMKELAIVVLYTMSFVCASTIYIERCIVSRKVKRLRIGTGPSVYLPGDVGK